MGAFKGVVVTNVGKDLLLQAMQGKIKIEFTKMIVGDGVYEDDEDLKLKTGLKSPKRNAIITSNKKIDTNCININANVNNEGLEEGFNITEIGLFAKSNVDENEILYAIAIAEHPDFLQAYSSKMPVNITERFFCYRQ